MPFRTKFVCLINHISVLKLGLVWLVVYKTLIVSLSLSLIWYVSSKRVLPLEVLLKVFYIFTVKNRKI